MIFGMRVMVAEDETFMREVIETILRKEGVTCLPFADGQAVLEAISGCVQLDALVLDFMMPRAHGLYVLKQIRTGRTGQPRDVPVAMLTSVREKGIVTKAVALDCDAFLVKPATRPMLAGRLGRITSRRTRPIKEVAEYESVEVGPPGEINDELPVTLGFEETLGEGVKGGGHDADGPIALLPFDQLMAGMVLARPLMMVDGGPVVPAGTTLTDQLLHLLGDLGKLVPLRPAAVRR